MKSMYISRLTLGKMTFVVFKLKHHSETYMVTKLQKPV